jgi:7,8-dihydroneopterin 2',3'-cyclic phosphate phosphodiesterase
MAEFKDLLEIAKKIKDQKLRKKVVDVLKNPGITSPEFKKYKPSDFKKTPGSISWHHTQEGGLVEHTYSVAMMAIGVAEALEKTYKVKLDKDALIAAALVHDVSKTFTTVRGKVGWEPSGCTLDHTMWGTSELYARGFPEKVVHIVASHFGEKGPTPPQTVEAIILHTLDNMDATLGTQQQQPNQEDLLKMLGLA